MKRPYQLLEMMRFMIPLLLFAHVGHTQSHDNLPFESIGDYPEAYTAENVLIRLISGLGYRYYWATKDLSERDINYRPSPEASSCSETLEHIYSLTQTTKNVIFDIPNVRPQEDSNMNHIQLREATLNTLHLTVQHLKTLDKSSIQKKSVQFSKAGKITSFPFWHLINGPISDALYHVGQVVSFRRTTGNPIHPRVNVFMGKNRD